MSHQIKRMTIPTPTRISATESRNRIGFVRHILGETFIKVVSSAIGVFSQLFDAIRIP
jgi:hypothetical protein